MTPVKEFTIDRRHWLRGNTNGGSYLLREIDQGRCCLGFYLRACGLSDDQLLGVGSPGYLARTQPLAAGLIPSWLLMNDDRLFDMNSVTATCLMEVNDDDTSDDAEKERFIIETFSGQGIKVTFV